MADMTDAKSQAPKDTRIIFSLSSAEKTAIDDWRYANHVPTRSEAIRALIRLGLKVAPS